MGELPLYEEESLRFRAPRLYDRMMEAFSNYNLHPYDAEATITQKEDGMDLSIRLGGSLTDLATIHISPKQAEEPDEEVISFFENAAEECKNLLIKNYFNMIKL